MLAGPAAQPETTGHTDSQVSQRRGGQEKAFLQGALEAQSVPLISAARLTLRPGMAPGP